MNIKEQELYEKVITEASTDDYAKLSTKELKDLLSIFNNVGRSSAKPILRSISSELNRRLKENSEELEEAKVVPFKKLEQAWTRTNGDKAKQAKLIKKHDLKKLISSVRPGEIKLGIKNKLLGTTKAATAVGLDLEDELIFITNNPLKIIYPKKSTRRPEGEEIKESKNVKTLRFEKVVSLTIKEDCEDIIESFISESNLKVDSTPAQIRTAYKTYSLSESAANLRKLKTSNKLSSAEYEKFSKLKAFNDKDWKWNSKEGLYHRVNEETELEEASASDIKKVLAAAKKAGGTVKGNQIDFGMGAVIDVSIEKGKIKLDAGLSNGVEYFKNAKDAIMAFESTDLEEAKIPSSNISKFSSPQAAKRAASKQKYKTQIFMGDDGTFWVPSTNKEAGQLKKDGYEVYESADLEEAIKVKTHKGMFSMKKGEESLRNWVDRIVIMSDAVKKNQRKTVAQNIVKAIESGKIKNADLTQDLGALIGIKSPKGMEAPANTVKAKLKDLGLSESTDLEEAVKFWTVTITKKAGKLFKGQTVDVKARNSAEAIKKGLKQMKADPNTVPSGSVDAVLGEAYDSDEKHTMDPKSHVERNKETGMYCVYNVKGKKVKEFESKEDAEEYAIKNHDALMKESTEIEEAKKYEAGKYYAKFGGRVVGPYDTEKDAYRDTKGDVEWIKKGKDINESAEIEEAKSDTQKDIESLKKMIKNPDPKRVKSYGGTKYVDMLKSKLAKLEESTDLEKTNTLTQDEYDEVQNFRNFKERDWKYDKKTKTYIRKNKL